jgi:hypothetical protein
VINKEIVAIDQQLNVAMEAIRNPQPPPKRQRLDSHASGSALYRPVEPVSGMSSLPPCNFIADTPFTAQDELMKVVARSQVLKETQSTLQGKLVLASHEQANINCAIHTLLARIRAEVHHISPEDALRNLLMRSSVQVIGLRMKQKLQAIVNEKLQLSADNVEESLQRGLSPRGYPLGLKRC